jgi:hypothetical protein
MISNSAFWKLDALSSAGVCVNIDTVTVVGGGGHDLF